MATPILPGLLQSTNMPHVHVRESGSPSLRSSSCGSNELQCQGQKCSLPAHIQHVHQEEPHESDTLLITCCVLQGSARLKLPALAARALAVLMQNDAANQQQTAAAGAAPSLLRLLPQQEAAPQHATLLGGWLLGRRLLEKRVEAATARRRGTSSSLVADEDHEEDSLCLDVSFVNKRTQLRNLDATSREALWRVLSAGTSSLVTAKEAAGALRVLAAGEVSSSPSWESLRLQCMLLPSAWRAWPEMLCAHRLLEAVLHQNVFGSPTSLLRLV